MYFLQHTPLFPSVLIIYSCCCIFYNTTTIFQRFLICFSSFVRGLAFGRPRLVVRIKLLRNFWRISKQKIEILVSILVSSFWLKETKFLFHFVMVELPDTASGSELPHGFESTCIVSVSSWQILLAAENETNNCHSQFSNHHSLLW